MTWAGETSACEDTFSTFLPPVGEAMTGGRRGERGKKNGALCLALVRPSMPFMTCASFCHEGGCV